MKRTNFLIDTLGCTATKTPSGHPYNRSSGIRPQKQPLSSPRVGLVQPTLSWMGAESNRDLKEAVFEAEWHMTCCKDAHWVFWWLCTQGCLLKNLFVSILTPRGKEFKQTNFLIDTLGCTATKTPSGHPYNRSCAIQPQKQPLSSPRLTQLPSKTELVEQDQLALHICQYGRPEQILFCKYCWKP